MADKLTTDVEILKREVADMKLIHGRLDNAISKLQTFLIQSTECWQYMKKNLLVKRTQ